MRLACPKCGNLSTEDFPTLPPSVLYLLATRARVIVSMRCVNEHRFLAIACPDGSRMQINPRTLREYDA